MLMLIKLYLEMGDIYCVLVWWLYGTLGKPKCIPSQGSKGQATFVCVSVCVCMCVVGMMTFSNGRNRIMGTSQTAPAMLTGV